MLASQPVEQLRLMDLYSWVELANLLSCVPALALAIRYFRRLDGAFRLLLLWFVVILIVETFNFYQVYQGRSNVWIYHFYMPVEFVLFMLILSSWQRSRRFRTLLIASIPFFVLLCLINLYVSGIDGTFNFLPVSVSAVLYVAVAAYTMLNLYRTHAGSLFKAPRFWALSALILYSSGTLVYFSFNRIVVEQAIVAIWLMHAGLYILTNQLYAVGFLCHRYL